MDQKQLAKIKIVYIIPSLDKGGAERFLLDLILNLDSNLFTPTLILFQRGGEWSRELENRNIPIKIFAKKYKFDIYNFWQIFKTLRKIQPQIVHTQLGGDIYGRLAAKILKIPVILSTEQNINKNENLIYNFLKRITNAWATKIIAISQAVKKDITKRYRANPQKIIIIPNGLEINRFLKKAKNDPKNFLKKNYSSPNNFSQKILTFGTIGRLVTQKGQINLIKAWAKLKNKNLSCLIAGKGPLQNKLKQKIKDYRLNEKIKLIGEVSKPADFLNSLDAFILPSVWEGQGIVLLEAGLIGLPIIASAVDGIKELLDEKTAWLVPANNPDILAQKIVWLANNLTSLEVETKIKKLQKHIINTYDIIKITKIYEKLYQDLLKKINYENTSS